MFQTVVNHRRALHRIPELDHQLPETVAYARSVLEPLGCVLSSPIPGSICAFFDAGKSETVAFRADMDALLVKAVRPWMDRDPIRKRKYGGHTT